VTPILTQYILSCILRCLALELHYNHIPTLSPSFTQNKFVPHQIFVSDPPLPPPRDVLEDSQRITF
jgi:hypothetical protein